MAKKKAKKKATKRATKKKAKKKSEKEHPRVFISYSHKDEDWKNRLVEQLGVLQKEGLLEVWEDRQIGGGDDWLEKITGALGSANVAVLMITASFLTSDFILVREVPKLLKRRAKEGVRVIPLIVRPCAWTKVKWLTAIQARPEDGKPLSSMEEHEVDQALADLAVEIEELRVNAGRNGGPGRGGVGKAMHPLEEKNTLENAFAIGALGDETDAVAGDVSDRSSQLERLIDSAARMKECVDRGAVLLNVAQMYGGGAELASSKYMPMVDMPQIVERASMRNETIGELLNVVSKHVWTAINGECGCGKTQLAVLLAKKHNKLGGWLGLRDYKEAGVKLDAACTVWSGRALGTNRRDFYNAVCKQFAAGSMLIIDDMPRLDGSDELSVRFALLGEACRAKNIKLVSTSNFELPTQLIAQFGGVVANIGIPPFNDADVKELFEAYGAPVHILTDEYISFFGMLARQNATLLAAMTAYLDSKNWVFAKEEFDDLVTGRYAGRIDEETITKFVRTVEDPDSRELLYRLRLAFLNFTREDVTAVATVKPTIKRPLEKLRLLLGPWVQREAENRFVVSPLIKRLRSSELEHDTEIGTYRVLAHRIMGIMQTRNIDQWEAQQAVTYFYLAGAYQNAAVVLLMVLRSLVEVEGPCEDGFLGLYWQAQELPEEINLGLRIYLRGMQICFSEKMGKDSSYLLGDLNELSRMASKDDAATTFAAASMILTKTKLIEKEPMLIYGLVTRAMKLLPEGRYPDGSKFEVPGPWGGEALIWIIASAIQDAEHLRNWTGLLEELTSEQREKAFALEEYDELAIVAANQLYLCEYNKPEESQDWDGVLGVLNEFAERVAALELWWLWACASYTKMIVLSEHMEKFHDAIEVGETVLDRSGDDPRVSFLIQQYIGKQYYYDRNFDDAFKWLMKAIKQETKVDKPARLNTLLCLSNIIGEKNPPKAIKFAEQGVQLAESMSDLVLNKQELVKALMELAIAKWLAVGVNAAFETWDRAGEQLLDCKNDSEEWKALFMGYGHVSGYFLHLASCGEPLFKMADGQIYARPWRGVFVRDHLRLAEAYVVGRESLIMVQISNFAEAVGNDNRAIYWAVRATEAGRAANRPIAESTVAALVIANSVFQKKYSEAIDSALRCGEILVAGMKLCPDGKGLLDAEFSPEDVLGNKPNELWKQAELHALSQGLIPIAFKLLATAISDSKLAQSLSDKVVTKCRGVSKTAVDSFGWEKAAELFEGIFSKSFRAQDMYRLREELQNDYYGLNWISHLGLCAVDDISLKDVCWSQVQVIHLVSKTLFRPNSITFRRFVLPFVSEFWTTEFPKQRVNFNSPRLVAESLEDARKIPETKRAQAILRTVVDGLDVRVGPDIRKWLNA